MPVSADKLAEIKRNKAKGGKGKTAQAESAFNPQIDQTTLDALNVADAAKKGTRAKDIADMTPYERKKRVKDRARKRINFDCDAALAEAIEALQEKYRKKSGDRRDPFPKSDLVELLVVLGMRQLIENGGGLRRLLRPTSSPHFMNRLAVPTIPDVSEYNADDDYD